LLIIHRYADLARDTRAFRPKPRADHPLHVAVLSPPAMASALKPA